MVLRFVICFCFLTFVVCVTSWEITTENNTVLPETNCSNAENLSETSPECKETDLSLDKIILPEVDISTEKQSAAEVEDLISKMEIAIETSTALSETNCSKAVNLSETSPQCKETDLSIDEVILPEVDISTETQTASAVTQDLEITTENNTALPETNCSNAEYLSETSPECKEKDLSLDEIILPGVDMSTETRSASVEVEDLNKAPSAVNIGRKGSAGDDQYFNEEVGSQNEIPTILVNGYPQTVFNGNGEECYSLLIVKLIVKKVLEHVKKHRNALDLIIKELQSELEEEPPLIRTIDKEKQDAIKPFLNDLWSHHQFDIYNNNCPTWMLKFFNEIPNLLSQLRKNPQCLSPIFGCDNEFQVPSTSSDFCSRLSHILEIHHTKPGLEVEPDCVKPHCIEPQHKCQKQPTSVEHIPKNIFTKLKFIKQWEVLPQEPIILQPEDIEPDSTEPFKRPSSHVNIYVESQPESVLKPFLTPEIYFINQPKPTFIEKDMPNYFQDTEVLSKIYFGKPEPIYIKNFNPVHVEEPKSGYIEELEPVYDERPKPVPETIYIKESKPIHVEQPEYVYIEEAIPDVKPFYIEQPKNIYVEQAKPIYDEDVKTDIESIYIDAPEPVYVEETELMPVTETEKLEPVPIYIDEPKTIYSEQTESIYLEEPKPVVEHFYIEEPNPIYIKDDATMNIKKPKHIYAEKPIHVEKPETYYIEEREPISVEKPNPNIESKPIIDNIHVKNASNIYIQEQEHIYDVKPNFENEPNYVEEPEPIDIQDTKPFKNQKPKLIHDDKNIYDEESEPFYLEEPEPAYTGGSVLKVISHPRPTYFEQSAEVHNQYSKPTNTLYLELDSIKVRPDTIVDEGQEPMYINEPKPVSLKDSGVDIKKPELIHIKKPLNIYTEESVPAYDDKTEPIFDEKEPVYIKPKPIYIEKPNHMYDYESSPTHAADAKLKLKAKHIKDNEHFYIETEPNYYQEYETMYVEQPESILDKKPAFNIEESIPNTIIEPLPNYIDNYTTDYENESKAYAVDLDLDYTQEKSEEIFVHNIPENVVKEIIKLINDNPKQHINDIIKVLKQNQHVINPQLYKIIFSVLNALSEGKVDSERFNEIVYYLIHPHTNNKWNTKKTQILYYLLLPDKTGHVETSILDVIHGLLQESESKSNSSEILDLILPLLKKIKSEHVDHRIKTVILALLNRNENNVFSDKQVQILLTFMKPNQMGYIPQRYIDIASMLINFDKISYFSKDNMNTIFLLMKRKKGGKIDPRAIEILHEILIPKTQIVLTKQNIIDILTFLKTGSEEYIHPKRLDIVLFLLNNVPKAPTLVNCLIKSLKDYDFVNSKFVDIILYLHKRKMLSFEILEVLISLLAQETTGHIDKKNMNNLLLLLEPYRTSHPKVVIDVYHLLNLETLPTLNIDMSRTPAHFKPLTINSGTDQFERHQNEGYNEQQQKKLLSNVLQKLQSEQNSDFVPELSENNNAYVELTYMLRNQKPYLNHPVDYVKYKIPVKNFMKNVQELLASKPQLNTDPAKLMQELIITGTVSEVSPNLKGLHRKDIIKLTFDDGKLIQAKVLYEKTFNLNDQIKVLQDFNSDVAPQEILQQNEMNSAKYYTYNGGKLPNPDVIGSEGNRGSVESIDSLRPIVLHLKNSISPKTQRISQSK